MPQHLQREIGNLKKKILHLGTIVEESVQRAVRSIEERDPLMAKKVIDLDREIDRMEIDLEEDGLKILALYQPVAIDLRFIIAVLKINNDLERIGDLAVNIAERSLFLCERPRMQIPDDIPFMAAQAQQMLRKSLDALINLDSGLAREVCRCDDVIDARHSQLFEKIESEIRRDISKIEFLIQVLSISRYLERIADHSTNIAEDVIYMVEGVIARHAPLDNRADRP